MRIDGPQITGSFNLNGDTVADLDVLVTTSSLNTYTSSMETTMGHVNTATHSLNTFTSSATTRLNTIEGVTGSYATTGSNVFVGNQTISGSVIPSVTNAYDLGSSTHQFRHIYISSGSLYIDGTKVLGSTSQELQITTDSGQSFKILEAGSDTITLQSADGNITLATSGGGDVIMDPTTGVIALKGTTQIYAGNKVRSSDGNNIVFGDGLTVSGSITVTGFIEAQELRTTYISSSILYRSGSTKFGDELGDTHAFTGSLLVSGSISVPGSGLISGSAQILNGTGFVKTNGTSITYDNTSYLPLGGGTLTGPLTGTTAVFVNGLTGYSLTSVNQIKGSAYVELSPDQTTYNDWNIRMGAQAADACYYITAGGVNVLTTEGYSVPYTVKLYSNGVQTLTMSNGVSSFNGNLLIGTTNADVGGSVLGTVIRSNGTMTAAINMTSPINYQSPFAADRMNTAGDGLMYGMWRAGIFQAGIGSTNTQRMDFIVGNGGNTTQFTRMAILQNGNIGINTTDPSNKLEVDGGSSAVALRVSTTNTGSGVASLILSNSSKSAFNDGVKIAHGGGYTSITDLNNTNVMTWDMSNTRVGIGTTTPSVRLDVVGNSTDRVSTRIRNSNGAGAASLILNPEGAGSGSTGDATIFFDCNNTAWVAGIDKSDSSKYKIANDVYGDFRANNYFTIQTNGNVGIGGSSPVVKLDVGGPIKNSGRVFSGQSVIGQITSNLDGALTRSYILVCDLNDIAGFSLNGFMNAASYTCWNMSSFYIMKNYSSTSANAGITGQYKAGGCDMNIVDLSYGGGRYIAIGYTSNPEIDVIWTGYRLTHMLNSDGTAQVIPQSSVSVNSTLASY